MLSKLYLFLLLSIVGCGAGINNLQKQGRSNPHDPPSVGTHLMGRLRTLGFETGSGSSLIEDGIGNTGGGAISTSIFRSGAASYRITPTSGNAQGITPFLGSTLALGTTVYLRIYVYFAGFPSGSTRRSIANIGSGVITLQAATGGVIRVYNGGTQVGGDSPALSLNTWYRLEIAVKYDTGATDTCIARIDGVDFVSVSGQSFTDTAINQVGIGCSDALSGNGLDVYFDDAAINDSTGSFQNSWPGPGKVVLLLPISDNQRGSWTGGAGGTTNLFDAINNIPPTGTATETDSTQIESADSSPDNSTDEYRANMTVPTDAGVPANAVTKVMQLLVTHGEDVATGTKTGSFLILSNPAQSVADTFTFGADVGALGTWPSNWTTTWGTAQYDPSVVLGTSPVVRIRKTDTGTRVASVCFAGAYLEYQEASMPIFAQQNNRQVWFKKRAF